MPNEADRKWRLGEDLSEGDNLLDNVTFEELISTVHCNCQEVNEKSVREEFKRILEIREQDMNFLLSKNMAAIIAAAKKGRQK